MIQSFFKHSLYDVSHPMHHIIATLIASTLNMALHSMQIIIESNKCTEVTI